MAQALYACVRAGKLDEAIDLSNHGVLQQSGGPSCFNGEAFVHTSGLSAKFEPHYVLASEPRDEDGDDDVSTFDDGSWRGNKRRKLWKSACVRGALNVRETHQPLSAFVNAAHKVKPLRSRAGSVRLSSTFIPDLRSVEISMPNMGGLPMGSSEHHV